MSTLVQNCLHEFIFSSKLNFFWMPLLLILYQYRIIGLQVIHGTRAQIRIEITENYKKNC
jgi:hypothetical protein